MNANTHVIAQYKSLPATEALERNIAQQRIPQPYGHGRSLSLQDAIKNTRKKRSFDMADLLDATAPVEQVIAFPTLEWTLLDETEDMDIEPHEASTYVPSASLSLPVLGQRSRFSCRHLVRSKSLKTSLCSLGGRSSCHSFIKGVEGSWGQFVCNEEEMISPISRSGQFVCNEEEAIAPISRSCSDCGIYEQ